MDAVLSRELAFVFERAKAPASAQTEWADCYTWDSAQSELGFRVHTKSTQFDNPIHAYLSFEPPDRPTTRLVCPHLSPAEFASCAPIAEALNASSRGPMSVLVRIAAVVKAVGANVSLLWPHSAAANPHTEVERHCGRLSYSLLAASPQLLKGYDALLSLFSVAVMSVRRSSICRPTPHRLTDDFDKMYQGLMNLPPLAQLIPGQASSLDVAELLPSALHVLNFAVDTAPVKLRLVTNPAESLVPSQYPLGHLLHPAREFVVEGCIDPAFDADAAVYGTTGAFHGSSIDNMHSIIQNGLQSYSYSRLEKNGAIFGAGVYLAESLQVAYSFASATGKLWAGSTLNPEPTHGPSHTPVRAAIMCVVAVDVVNVPKYRVTESEDRKAGPSDHTAYLVVDNKAHMRIRRLFVYHTRPGGSGEEKGAGGGVVAPPRRIPSLWLLAFLGAVVAYLFTRLLLRR